MPNVNLSGMTVDALMDLRTQVDETLLRRRADIEKQLERMGAVVGFNKQIFGVKEQVPGGGESD